MEEKILSDRDYRLIAELSLAAKRRVTGLVTGEQRSPVQGGGIEFADYRAYQPGDDVRRIDWAVFLRLRRLLIRLCAEEKELTLMVALDLSRSMRFGNPDKFWFALRLAAILSGIALHDGNRAGVVGMGRHLVEVLRPQRSQTSLMGLVRALGALEPEEEADPAGCIREYAAKYGRRAMVVLISDLLYADWPQVLGGLAASGAEGFVLQLLAPEELEPTISGEMTLVDMENLGEVPLHLDRHVAGLYQRELAAFLDEVRQTCRQKGLWHTAISSAWSIDEVLRKDLRRGGPVW